MEYQTQKCLLFVILRTNTHVLIDFIDTVFILIFYNLIFLRIHIIITIFNSNVTKILDSIYYCNLTCYNS